MKIDSFVAQHKEIGEIVSALEALLNPSIVADKADDVRAKLSLLSGKVTIHLAMEDKVLYPTMLNCSNQTASQTAQKFKEEMGAIGGIFKTFVDKWNSAEKIKTGSSEFCNETKGLFSALKDRIKREEGDLYKLAETV